MARRRKKKPVKRLSRIQRFNKSPSRKLEKSIGREVGIASFAATGFVLEKHLEKTYPKTIGQLVGRNIASKVIPSAGHDLGRALGQGVAAKTLTEQRNDRQKRKKRKRRIITGAITGALVGGRQGALLGTASGVTVATLRILQKNKLARIPTRTIFDAIRDTILSRKITTFDNRFETFIIKRLQSIVRIKPNTKSKAIVRVLGIRSPGPTPAMQAMINRAPKTVKQFALGGALLGVAIGGVRFSRLLRKEKVIPVSIQDFYDERKRILREKRGKQVKVLRAIHKVAVSPSKFVRKIRKNKKKKKR